MKNYRLILILVVALLHAGCASTSIESTGEPKKKPTQHLKIADITTTQDAKRTFIDKTAELNRKTKLDVVELQEIHIITYTLEKSVAYFVENLTGERHKLAKQIAVIVEDIHINSEGNQKASTRKHLDSYTMMAEKFISGF